MMTILLGAMATHSIERESETYLLSSMVMTKHFTAVQFYGRISQMEINIREFRLIKYCLDNAMVNLHTDTKKIATDVLIKLSNQVKDHEN